MAHTKQKKRVSVINYKMHTHIFFIIIIVQQNARRTTKYMRVEFPPFIVIIMILYMFEMNIRTQETHKLISLFKINAIAQKKCVCASVKKNG